MSTDDNSESTISKGAWLVAGAALGAWLMARSKAKREREARIARIQRENSELRRLLAARSSAPIT